MSDNGLIENLRASAARMGFSAMSMGDFSAMLIIHVRGGGSLDDAALLDLRARCVENLKNSQMGGLPVEQEAEIFRQAIADLEQFLDRAIERGRSGK